MAETGDLTPEQKTSLDKQVASIGHNQGPALVARTDEIVGHVAKHHLLGREATRVRVMLDMLGSHLKGEHLLPVKTAQYATAGIVLATAIAGLQLADHPVETLLLDLPVLSAVFAAIGGEMQSYVYWRAEHDPSYATIKAELYGK
jgi:hypothetical protein